MERKEEENKRIKQKKQVVVVVSKESCRLEVFVALCLAPLFTTSFRLYFPRQTG